MGIPLVSKLMTLNDLERHNGCLSVFISLSSVDLGPVTSPWLKLDPYSPQQKCTPKNLVFGNIWFMVIFVEIT